MYCLVMVMNDRSIMPLWRNELLFDAVAVHGNGEAAGCEHQAVV